MNSQSSDLPGKSDASSQLNETDSNVLFGILALQMNYIDREQLTEAVSDWALDKSAMFEKILLEKGWLDQSEAKLLQQMVNQQIGQAGEDTEKNLAATISLEQVQKNLEGIDDDNVNTVLLNTAAKFRLQESATSATSSASAVSLSDHRFSPISELGRGGMGKVSLAEDGELHRKVALKELLVSHKEYPDAHRRFVLEAEITGSLEHPGIVPIYSSSQDEEGRPFYAMQLIRGKSMHDAIMDYHKEKNKGGNENEQMVKFRQLLGRFISVCYAIDYAHSRSVIHRDIKPSNVMLGEFGETYVVDWGLAKAQVSDGDETSLDRTAFLPRSSTDSTKTNLKSTLGTPAFMSPEQAARNWKAMGPASDIYSLGATLYCLLVGKPYVTGKKLTTVLEQVQKGEFPRPREIKANVHPALEAIVLKGMALEPADRYETAGDMAKDLENWLADEPVEAWEEPFLVKLGRWARRHRTQIRAAVAGLLLMLAISILLSIQLSKSLTATKKAKVATENHFKESQLAADTWLTVASERMKYFPSLQQPRQLLLEMAAKDYQRFSGLIQDDADLRTEYGRTLLRQGDIQKDLEQFDAAEESYRSAKAVFDELSKQDSNNSETRLYLGICLGRLGSVLNRTSGNEKEAKESLQSAVEILENASSKDLANSRLQIVKSQILVSLAEFLEKSNQLDKAHTILQSAIADLNELVSQSENPVENQEYRWQWSKALLRMGELQRSRSQNSESHAAYEKALEILSQLSQGDPSHPGYLDDMATTQIGIANTMYAEDPDNAATEGWYTKGIKSLEDLVAVLPDVTRYRRNLILAIGNYSQYLHRVERNKDAETILANYAFPQLEILKSYSNLGYQKNEAISLAILGMVSIDLNKYEPAVEQLRAATVSFKQSILQNSQDQELLHWSAVCQSQIGRAYAAQGKDIDAKAAFLNAISELENLVLADQENTVYRHALASSLKHQGDLLWKLNEQEEAKAAYSRSLLLGEKLTEDAEPMHEYARLLASCPLEDLRDTSKAIEIAKQAVKLVPANSTYSNTLGQCLFQDGQWEESRKTLLHTKAELRSRENSFDDFYLAMCAWKLDNKTEAKTYYDQALALMNENQPGNPELKSLESQVKKLLEISAD